jgi:hypothetical protein
MPDILKVSALHARSVNAFLHRLPSLNTASVAKQRFYIKRFFRLPVFRYFLRFGLDRVLRNTGWVEGRDYKTHGPGRAWPTLVEERTGRAGPGRARRTTGRAEKFRPVLSS